ncbi:MAG TPA: luciferase family protein, partial [Solirubrobacterales bacterium]|nr:luciferase family protein [Solirubrobacterales bacterium]
MFEETRTPSEQITQTVTAWDGVEAGYGKRGEYGFRISGHEVGHLHGDHAAHFSFG